MPPLTPMESGGTWATLAQETAFLAAVAVENPSVTIKEMLSSHEGVPVPVVAIGDPADARVVVIAGQHGNEPAPREAALRFVRDVAASSEPTPVIVVTTANPFGAWMNARPNARDMDVNRSHVALNTPEALTIASVIASAPDAIVIDAHEATSPDASGNPVTGEVNFQTHGDVAAPAYRSWAETIPGLIGAAVPGATVAVYPRIPHEGALSNARAAAGRPAILLETLIYEPPAARVAWQLAVMHAALSWPSPVGMVTEAAAWNAGEGFLAHAPLFMYESGYQAAPVGYLAPSAVRPVLAAHGVTIREARRASPSIYVPMDQPARYLIAWLLDPRAPRPITPHATPVFSGDSPAIDLASSDYELPTLVRVGGSTPRRLVVGGVPVWGT